MTTSARLITAFAYIEYGAKRLNSQMRRSEACVRIWKRPAATPVAILFAISSGPTLALPTSLRVNASSSALVARWVRSEEHTSELQSLMRISYAVFCLKKKTTKTTNRNEHKQYNT